MKRKQIVTVFLLFSILCSLMACNGSASESNQKPRFEFSYSVERTKYTQGETITITVEAKNNGEDYAYVGDKSDLFGPASMKLSSTTDDYELSAPPFANTDDATERVFKEGETASRTYYFNSDENSLVGFYDMEFPFANTQGTFAKVIEIEE